MKQINYRFRRTIIMQTLWFTLLQIDTLYGRFQHGSELVNRKDIDSQWSAFIAKLNWIISEICDTVIYMGLTQLDKRLKR